MWIELDLSHTCTSLREKKKHTNESKAWLNERRDHYTLWCILEFKNNYIQSLIRPKNFTELQLCSLKLNNGDALAPLAPLLRLCKKCNTLFSQDCRIYTKCQIWLWLTAFFPTLIPPGNIIQLGSGTMLRFNHPSEAAQLREKRQVQTVCKTNTDKPCFVLFFKSACSPYETVFPAMI